MKKLLLSTLCSLIATSAFATTWETVEFDANSVWFLDIDQLTRKNGIAKSRLLLVDLRPETAQQPGQLVRAEFDCNGQRIRFTEIRHLSRDGRWVTETLGPDWVKTNPGTTGETLLKATCRQGPRHQNLVRDNGSVVQLMLDARAKFPAIIRQYLKP